jgi:hypothetical protein
VSGLRQLLEFGLFHGDPHPGNIFCLRDGRIAYVDFGNVAQLSNANKQVRAAGRAFGAARCGGTAEGSRPRAAARPAAARPTRAGRQRGPRSGPCRRHSPRVSSIAAPSPCQVLVDAVVHAVNEDYQEMAGDFIKLGFLTPGTDINPIVPALEKIWRDSRGQSLADFNFRWVVGRPAAFGRP